MSKKGEKEEEESSSLSFFSAAPSFSFPFIFSFFLSLWNSVVPEAFSLKEITNVFSFQLESD